jgi:hypothetical protein
MTLKLVQHTLFICGILITVILSVPVLWLICQGGRWCWFMLQPMPRVGRELANKVADRLDRGGELYNHHFEYCGVGLCGGGGYYLCAGVNDGEFDGFSDYLSCLYPQGFTTRPEVDTKAFIEWLSSELDTGRANDPYYGDLMDVPRIWRGRDEFVNWLSKQTDDSLAGKELAEPHRHNNQRLTIDRLRKFAL